MRKKSSVGRINIVETTGDVDHEVTALQFDDDTGYLMAAGSSAGKISIYDLRMSDPIRIKDHMYGNPIVDIKWHKTLNSAEPKIISADSHIVRIWDPMTGANMTSKEPRGGTINDICTFRESGLMLLALDCSQIAAEFIPALGLAPKWCSYLENLTEEMEEDPETSIYDNLKFLTKEELERLEMTNLIGTNLLKPYMHGFFVDYQVYKKARALADPSAYDSYIEKRKQEKIEAERASRITIKRKLPKVNRLLAARILEQEQEDTEVKDVDDISTKKKPSKKNKGFSSEFLKDARFSAMFENKDFEVDELSTEYLALHPQSAQKQPSLIEEHFEAVSGGDEEQSTSDSEASDTFESEDESNAEEREVKKNSTRVRLYEVKDERHADAFWNDVSLAKEDALPIGERVAALKDQQPSGVPSDVKLGPGGSREISFISRGTKRYKADVDTRENKRRGIHSLGLKPDKSEFYGMGRSARGRGGRGRGRGRGRR